MADKISRRWIQMNWQKVERGEGRMSYSGSRTKSSRLLTILCVCIAMGALLALRWLARLIPALIAGVPPMGLEH